jgi:hypothetical protein
MPQPALAVAHEVTEEHLVEEGEVEAAERPHKKEPRRRAASLLETFREYPPHVRWLLIAVAVLLPVSILLLYLLLGSGGKQVKLPARDPIRVAPGPSALYHALQKARDGDRLLLGGDINECMVTIPRRDLIIEPEQGKHVTWRCPPNARPDSKLMLVGSAAAGLHLRGIALDGGGQTEALVTIFGKCPGVRLENLELRNSRKYGLLIMSGEGSEKAPVHLDDLTFQTPAGQTAVRFDLQKEIPDVSKNRFFLFRDCRFEGPGQKFTTPDLKFVDPATLELPKGAQIDRAS